MIYSKKLKEIDKLQNKIDSFRPLKKEEIQGLKNYFRIGLTYSSNALEGNSLTETETKIVIEDGLTIGGKPMRDHYEALGHSEAYDLIFSLSQKKEAITEAHIKKLHKLFYHRIDSNNAGKYRKVRVFISGSTATFPAPQDVSLKMKKFVAVLKNLDKKNPIESAALAHKEFVFIHPFIDGNGRVARLLMNLVLLNKGYVITIIPPILRREYIRTLEKAHQNDHDFIDFIAGRVLETQKDYLRLLKN